MRFVDALDSILVLAGTLRQLLGDHINTAGGVAAAWGQEVYVLAGVKFVVRHGVSAPRRKRVYHTGDGRVSGHHGSGGGKGICVRDRRRMAEKAKRLRSREPGAEGGRPKRYANKF